MNARRFELAVVLAVLLTSLTASITQASTSPATGSVTLAWDPSSDPAVAGYRLYQGVVSQTYTNKLECGKTTSVTVSNLVRGMTYYFAVTDYYTNGLESAFSGEITYTVPATTVLPVTLSLTLTPGKQVNLTATGTAGYVYDVLASTNGLSWTSIGSTTVGTNGFLQFLASSTTNRACFYRLRQMAP
jgi:hypothetical protein